MRPLDYGRSYICHSASFNAVRFWVESRTRIVDVKLGTHFDFHQCGSCKSEHTFAEANLFHDDNYDFLPVFGVEDLLIFRRPSRLGDRYREVTKCAKVWGHPLRLREASKLRKLADWDEMLEAASNGMPMVGQTEIWNHDTGLRAVMEYPVKTLNLSLEKRMYQVDTGPLAFPDLTIRHDPLIACLNLAFVAFNRPDVADFVEEQPTGVMEGGREICKVYHYSGPFSLPSVNRLFALQVPS